MGQTLTIDEDVHADRSSYKARFAGAEMGSPEAFLTAERVHLGKAESVDIYRGEGAHGAPCVMRFESSVPGYVREDAAGAQLGVLKRASSRLAKHPDWLVLRDDEPLLSTKAGSKAVALMRQYTGSSLLETGLEMATAKLGYEVLLLDPRSETQVGSVRKTTDEFKNRTTLTIDDAVAMSLPVEVLLGLALALDIPQ